MRKCVYLLAVIAVLALWSCGEKKSEAKGADSSAKKEFKVQEKANYAAGEKEAQQVLVAYITRDLELLKTYAAGMLKSALDEKAMERPNDRERIESWDGAIKEVRYSSDTINFEKVYYAYACYIGDPQKDEKIYTVTLKSTDKVKWAISLNPLGSMKSKEFNARDAAVPE